MVNDRSCLPRLYRESLVSDLEWLPIVKLIILFLIFDYLLLYLVLGQVGLIAYLQNEDGGDAT